jgi:hypothetical protein
MLYIDVKYAKLIASKLRNYKQTKDLLWNFSCPICGDSKKNKLKARGYIYKSRGPAPGLSVICHKCGYSKSLGNFIRELDPILYQEYALENYAESGAPRSSHSKVEDAIPKAIFKPQLTDSVLEGLKRIDNLSLDHPAVKYCIKRKIPSKFWHLLYFAPRFKHYVNTVVPNKFPNAEKDYPRLVIPYFNAHGKCFAFQGRAFGEEIPKYYTIKIDETEERIFGLDRLNYAKRVYIVEGPLDSLFIPNTIAVSGSSFTTPTIKSLMSNATIVYDNEPRSPELTRLIKSTIDQGYHVCLWPETIVEKDINDMIKAEKTPEEILDIINANTYSGVEAQLRFATWRKC